jgi:multicomponent Na+:H+ antiporter subunit E
MTITISRHLVAAAALMAVWILLWGELSVGNVATGLVLIPFVVYLTRADRVTAGHRVHLGHLMSLAGFFLVALVRSSAQVIMAVLAPNEARLRAGIVATPLTTSSRLVATLVSDLITLTPGTLVLEAAEQPTVLYVHVLGLGDPDAVRRDVLDLEQRVVRAIRPVPPRVAEVP